MASTTVVDQRDNGHIPRGAPRRTRRRPELASQPMSSLVAAATVLSGRRITRARTESWQGEAWDLYDEVGELRFVANAIAGAMSQARLFVGKVDPSGAGADPEPVESGDPVDVFSMLGGGPLGRAQILQRIALQLFVPGDGWIVGLPPGVLDDAPTAVHPEPAADVGISPALPETEEGVRLSDLSWHVMSVTEVQARAGQVRIKLGDVDRVVPERDVLLVRVWRPHPRQWWRADSPTRANLPVLRQIVGLAKHVAASIDSRLAGAGLLVLPESASIIGGIAQSDQQDEDPEVDPFLAALMDAMLTPIKDRDSAAAVVPLTIKVADDVAAQITQDNLIRFSTPFDERTKELQDDAIRRLALGLDTTPEMLLGMGDVNHWSAWLLDEINAKVHIEPVLALICDALTVGYLRPALEEAGMTAEQAAQHVVWWDLTDLTLRPDRSSDAKDLHDRGAIGDATLRSASGFDDTDAPEESEKTPREQAVAIAMDLVVAAPSLAQTPGIGPLVEQIEAVLSGDTPDAPVSAVPPPAAPPTPDDDADDGREPPSDEGPPSPAMPTAASAQMWPMREDAEV